MRSRVTATSRGCPLFPASPPPNRMDSHGLGNYALVTHLPVGEGITAGHFQPFRQERSLRSRYRQRYRETVLAPTGVTCRPTVEASSADLQCQAYQAGYSSSGRRRVCIRRVGAHAQPPVNNATCPTGETGEFAGENWGSASTRGVSRNTSFPTERTRGGKNMRMWGYGREKRRVLLSQNGRFELG